MRCVWGSFTCVLHNPRWGRTSCAMVFVVELSNPKDQLKCVIRFKTDNMHFLDDNILCKTCHHEFKEDVKYTR